MSGDTADGRSGPKENPKRPRPLKQLTREQVGWPPALRELKELLYEVYVAADAPSLDDIAGAVAADDDLAGAPSRDTVHRVLTKASVPPRRADVVAIATVLARRAVWDAPALTGRVCELWGRARMAQGVGRPVSDFEGDERLLLDDGLGIHPALDTDDAHDGFSVLPAYIRRKHDARLGTVVDDARDTRKRRSGIAVLVGGSSTGKTRALWEAVRGLPDSWRLWHPLSPTAPEAVLAALPDVAPYTVVWLNEAQHYLGPDPLGEQVAAGLRELLHDPSRAPVLVLGTLWPKPWDTLTGRTDLDRHAVARGLLSEHKIDVPDAFTPADMAALDAANSADPRLKAAAERANDAQITQYLAGVPYLMERYHAARGATLALIHAAMDARRLGAGLHIPHGWLIDATTGYLTDTEYHTLDTDWQDQALKYATTRCNGIPGILTCIDPSDTRNQRTRRPGHLPQGPHYMLTDYLDQHGRHERAELIPPINFWQAAARHAHPTDLAALGRAAWDRGLYRDSAQLHKRATTHGDTHTAEILVEHLHTLHPIDHRPAQWAAAHASLDDPAAVAGLLEALREAGADEQTAALAERAARHACLDGPGAAALLLEALWEAGVDEQTAALAERAAAHAPLDDPAAVVWLLEVLREAGADEQTAALLARDPAAHATFDSPHFIAELLEALWEAGADEQVTALAERAATQANPHAAWLLEALREAGVDEQTAALAERAAAHACLDDPYAVAQLLKVLREAGADEQTAALLARDPAAHASLDTLDAVARLLNALREAGADEQVTALAERAAAHTPLDDPAAVARLLNALREAGADEQTAALAEGVAAHACLDDPFDVAWLLKVLREAGADEQTAALLARDPAAHASLDNPGAIARLLNALREAGADEQTAALLARDPAAHASLDNPDAVAQLLKALREAGADEQTAALLARAPAAHASLDGLFDVAWLLTVLREAGADEQTAALLARDPAAHASLDDPRAVAWLLEVLREAGADEQVTALAERAAAHACLDDPFDVAWLLKALWEAGADEQAAALAERAAAHTPLDGLFDVAWLLKALWKAGADEQAAALAERAAAHTPLDGPGDAALLLEALREAGADEQTAALAERLPAAGRFDLFIQFGGNQEHFRFGREPDGSAAPSWAWNDLD
ncbi:hypothetical protein OG923_33535 (plasmid) [Streptomyces halstedii]|uniref:hypothetical protein n=1 Tax=Streptomyces halstedii TaxID=1944 RepID=UPI002F90F711